MRRLRLLIPLLTSTLTLIPAAHFLMTNNPDSFCAACVLGVISLAMWLDYELELAARVTDMELEEWVLKQQQEEAFRIMLNKRIIQRELISFWEKTA